MKIKKKIFIFLAYLVLAIFFTFPLIIKINNSYGTIYGSNSEFFIWSLWKFRYDILELKTNPLVGKDFSVFYPVGYLREATGYDNLINLVPGFFLQYFFNPITTYNILILFNLSFAAFAAFVLVDYFIKNPKISFVSGVVFGFSPFMLIRTLGHLNVLTTGWMVLFIYFFIRMIREKNIKLSFLSAVFYFLTAISFWYYAVFGIFFIMFFFIYSFFKTKLRKKLLDKAFIKNLFLFFILSVILTLPIAFPFLKVIFKNQTTIPDFSHLYLFSASVFSYFVSFPVFFIGKILKVDPVIALISGNPLEFTSFIGILEIAFFLFFLTNYPKREIKKTLTTFIIVFFIISLGPYLKPSKIILPYKIFTFLPFLNFVRSINRFSIFVNLGISLVLALSIKEISKKFKPLKFNIFVLVCFLIIIFERIIFPFPLKKIDVSYFYKDLKNQKGNFAILDLPTGFYEEYNFFQITHTKNIAMGRIQDTAISKQIQTEVFKNKFVSFSLCFPVFPDWVKDAGFNSEYLEKDTCIISPYNLLNSLNKKNIFYIVIHKKIIESCPPVQERLNKYFNDITPYFEDDQIKVFRTY